MGGGQIALGDPGLLASLLFDFSNKKYSLGIIPHYVHLNHPLINEIYKNNTNSTIINVLEEPLSVLTKIAQCECIVSTSLHGLIIADSFNIPNQWIHISMLGGEHFKFFDYYSSFDIEPKAIDLNTEALPSIDDIKANYKITPKMVLKKQNELIKSFPYICDKYISVEQNSALTQQFPNDIFIISSENKILCLENNIISYKKLDWNDFSTLLRVELNIQKKLAFKYQNKYISEILENGSVSFSQNPKLFSYKKTAYDSFVIFSGDNFLCLKDRIEFSKKEELGTKFAFFENNYIAKSS
ncbi:polysaccharide pyruvyl transferase family protein [Campylobacter hyointestinalis]|uniref:polysaccharide pyruvyl transferase family protein n=1 Tax=Campylobacter hyointestinalis TaxID=198 RepID=UPI000DCDCD4E|nr:polysaccharide pyruvyl transferase family protein [Campylobacter hyointestinalis]RAZ49947.1 hypothetical protein CHL9004_04015 [Campylobacter hyointestinalis subsp. lawsonii]